jgi:hypothetical protein
VDAGSYRAEPIAAMLERGMCALTGTRRPAEAWRRFFQPTDIVGIKLSPVGRPFVCSSPEMLHAIVAGLGLAGVPPENIRVFERYREILDDAAVARWLPAGVRLSYASPGWTAVQQDMEGYDAAHFVELPFTLPQSDPRDPAARRSYAARFVTREITKLINLPTLKSHNAAGVTLALKSLSHGLVNNVSRSHDGPRLRIAEFTPAVVAMPAIRTKTVLHILDGTKGLYHGGPGIMHGDFVWEHKTVYLATDPVALDRVGWMAIDEQRERQHLPRVGERYTDAVWKSPERQPEHIVAAGRAGLGEADPAKIDVRRIRLA